MVGRHWGAFLFQYKRPLSYNLLLPYSLSMCTLSPQVEPSFKFTPDGDAKQVKLLVKLPGVKAPPEVSVTGSTFTLKDEAGKFFLEVNNRSHNYLCLISSIVQMDLPPSVDSQDGKDMQAKFRKSKRDMVITFPLSVKGLMKTEIPFFKLF